MPNLDTTKPWKHNVLYKKASITLISYHPDKNIKKH